MKAALTMAGLISLTAGAVPVARDTAAAPQAAEWREEHHPGGQLKSRVLVRGGLREGVEHRWHANGRLASVRVFAGDLLHGHARSWYADGSPHEERWFAGGQEVGRQRAFAPGGELYLNYEMRGGRRYGLVNAKPCLPAAGATEGM